MKSEARKILIKDLIIVLIAITIGFVFSVSQGGLESWPGGILIGFVFAGIPFGWRWLNNIFVAMSLFMILVKFFGALVLGWIALPIVLIKDIVVYVREE